jgi:hypothetical protein
MITMSHVTFFRSFAYFIVLAICVMLPPLLVVVIPWLLWKEPVFRIVLVSIVVYLLLAFGMPFLAWATILEIALSSGLIEHQTYLFIAYTVGAIVVICSVITGFVVVGVARKKIKGLTSNSLPNA